MNDALLVLAVSTVAGIIQAIFWRWVSVISDNLGKSEKKIHELNTDIAALRAEIYHDYCSKTDSHRDTERVMDLLRELKNDVKKLDEKLDKKADKL